MRRLLILALVAGSFGCSNEMVIRDEGFRIPVNFVGIDIADPNVFSAFTVIFRPGRFADGERFLIDETAPNTRELVEGEVYQRLAGEQVEFCFTGDHIRDNAELRPPALGGVFEFQIFSEMDVFRDVGPEIRFTAFRGRFCQPDARVTDGPNPIGQTSGDLLDWPPPLNEGLSQPIQVFCSSDADEAGLCD
jgi:hypothetical protein